MFSSEIFSNLRMTRSMLYTKYQDWVHTCAGFVLRRFARQEDLATLNAISISKSMDFSILKLAYKALHDDSFPEYLRLSLHCVNAYSL